jgi:hypothetical protein
MSPPPNGGDLMVVDGGNKRARKTPVAAVRAFLDYSISLEIEVDALTFCCLLLSTESLLSTATSTSSTLPLPSSESSPPSPLRLASSKPAKLCSAAAATSSSERRSGVTSSDEREHGRRKAGDAEEGHEWKQCDDRTSTSFPFSDLGRASG